MNNQSERFGIRLASIRQSGSVIVAFSIVLIMFLIGMAMIKGFASHNSILSLLVLASFVGIAAIGQNLVILLGGIDMSLPYMMTLGNLMIPFLNHLNVPFSTSVMIVLAIAVVVGAVNGMLSSWLKLHPLIITLGVGYIVNGILYLVTKGIPTGDTPKFLESLAALNGRLFGLHFPPVVFIWLILSVLVVWMLRGTRWGRQIYAVGANPKASELVLIKPVKVWTYTYVASAVLAATAGMLLSGFSGGGSFGIGDPYLFVTVGAVAIGGTSLLGGAGGYLGTLAGVLILTEINMILTGLNVEASEQKILYGIIVLIMIAIYGRELHIKNRL
jgi:ribose transport system permease protein